MFEVVMKQYSSSSLFCSLCSVCITVQKSWATLYLYKNSLEDQNNSNELEGKYLVWPPLRPLCWWNYSVIHVKCFILIFSKIMKEIRKKLCIFVRNLKLILCQVVCYLSHELSLFFLGAWIIHRSILSVFKNYNKTFLCTKLSATRTGLKMNFVAKKETFRAPGELDRLKISSSLAPLKQNIKQRETARDLCTVLYQFNWMQNLQGMTLPPACLVGCTVFLVSPWLLLT